MNIDEIKRNAPEGATHYWIGTKTNSCYYFKRTKSKFYAWNMLDGWFEGSDDFGEIKPL